jgi:hypothetical protein
MWKATVEGYAEMQVARVNATANTGQTCQPECGSK